MSFIVRQISRTSDGREIVRPRGFAQPQLLIGRSADSDIHLPDLAVTLHHAVIQLLGPNRIEIAASAGLPISVDGRSTERAEIDVAKGSNIRIGSHVLTVSKGDGEEASEVLISVERVGALSEASQDKDEQKVFSLASAAPGKRVSAWALALAVLALFLIWPISSFFANHDADAGERRPVAFHADEMWSSGKLSLAHSNLENNCKACHASPGVAIPDSTCLSCHNTLHDHADPARLAVAMPAAGPGGKIQGAFAHAFNKPEGRCVQCHTEHQGATAMPVTEQKFCSDCHTGLNERLTDTKILNASDFGKDHPEFRPAIMTNPGGKPIIQRLSLAARPLEDNGLKFPHDIHLSQTNSIARMARTIAPEYGYSNKGGLVCANCHVPDASGSRFTPVSMEKNCQACHSLAFDRIGGTVRTLRHGDPKQVVADIRAFYRSTGPVRPANFDGMARRRPGDFAMAGAAADFRFAAAARPGQADSAIRNIFSQGGACFDCHSVIQPTSQAAMDYRIVPVSLPQRYMQLGWFDHKAHETETCASCHAAKDSGSAADVLLPKLASCQECHGGATSTKAVPSSCAMCHDYHMGSGTPLMRRDYRIRGERRSQLRPGTERAAGSGAAASAPGKPSEG